jgi:serine/threonine protein kinase
MYVEHKRKQADSVWLIKTSELQFDDPPEILGRGTFGLVVRAEYRGTQVAVKRVIPPRTENKDVTTDIIMLGSLGLKMEPRRNTPKPLPGQDKYFNFQKEDNQLTSLTLKSFSIRSFGQNGKIRMLERVPSTSARSKTYNQLKADFIHEMRLLSKLRHPCITTVMGAVISPREEPLLVMELMDHGSLFDLLHNETMIVEGEMVLQILRDIAQGLRFLHAAKPQVIHGDLKAQNVLVDSKFRAKVADFGLSQKKDVGASGTPFWMAPELLRGESTNTAASRCVFLRN